MQRSDTTFPAAQSHCSAWLYRPDAAAEEVPCVVMAHGLSLTRHEALASYAERFAGAGLAVLVFDYRHFGDSPGEPRGRFRVRLQREDLRAAIAYVRSLPEVDSQRIVLWGYSAGCVNVLKLAASESDGIAAVLAVAPFVEWAAPRARHTTAANSVDRATSARRRVGPPHDDPGDRASRRTRRDDARRRKRWIHRPSITRLTVA